MSQEDYLYAQYLHSELEKKLMYYQKLAYENDEAVWLDRGGDFPDCFEDWLALQEERFEDRH